MVKSFKSTFKFTVISIAFTFSVLHAQDLIIHTSDGNYGFELSEITEIQFDDETMGIYSSSGEASFNVFSIEYIEFGEYLSSKESEALTNLFSFNLSQNYPNPFNPNTTIEFELSSGGETIVAVYNLVGQKVGTLYSGELSSGKHSFVWDGTDDSGKMVASGVYFYNVSIDGLTKNKRMLLLK
jgi:hypothetical protein